LKQSKDNLTKQITDTESGRFKGYEIEKSYWDNCSIFPEERLYVNLIVKYSFEKKDGSRSLVKNSHIRVYFDYCPICGIKLEE